MPADCLGKFVPSGVIVLGCCLVYLFATGEEDVHRLGQDAALRQPPAQFAQAAAQRQGQSRGLIVLQVVQTRVNAGQAQNLREKEMEVGRQFLDDFLRVQGLGSIDGRVVLPCDMISGGCAW